MSDQNPLLSGYALSGPLPSDLDASLPWSLATQYSWANSAIAEASSRETLVVDAETRELRLKAQRIFATGYAVRVEVPYRTLSGGSLDGFIDNWHDIFGLPEGAHASFKDDSLRLLYRRDGINLIDSRESTSGIGDLSIAVGRALVDADDHSATVWLGASLPTGDAKQFTGSDSLGFTAALSTRYQLGANWSVFGQIFGAWIGDGERLREQQRNWIASGMLGVTAHATDAFTITLQFDAHTRVFETDDLKFLGDAVMVSLGGTYRFPQDWVLSLGLTEDIAVESTTDVVFLFDFKKNW